MLKIRIPEYKNDHKKQLDQKLSKAQTRLTDLSRNSYKKLSERDWDYVPPNPTIIDFAMREIDVISSYQVYDPFDYALSADSHTNDYLISTSIKERGLSKLNSDTKSGLLLSRYNDISRKVMGWKNNPRALLEFSELYKVDDNNITEINFKGMSENISKTVTKNWVEKNASDNNDIFEYIDGKQKEILTNFKYKNTLLTGYAGTGKTIVGNELISMISDKTATKMLAFYPNNGVLKQSKSFFDEINNDLIEMHTFASYEQEIINEEIDRVYSGIYSYDIAKMFFRKLNLQFSKKSSMYSVHVLDKKYIDWFMKLDNLRIFNHIFSYIIENMDSAKKYFDKNTKKLFENAISQKPRDQVFSFINIKEIIDNFSYKIDEIKKLLLNKEEIMIFNTSFIKNNNCDKLIWLQIVKNHLVKKRLSKYVYIDETPLIYLNDFLILSSILKRQSSIKIYSYDRYQYPKYDPEYVKLNNDRKVLFMDMFEKNFPHEDLFKLDMVYRTTKQIFAKAASVVNIVDWKNEIDSKDSLSNDTNLKIKIKFSYAIKNINEIIGREIDELSVDIDIVPDEYNKHILYVLLTRAITKLNIMGKYAKYV